MKEQLDFIMNDIKKLAEKAYEKGRADALKELEKAKAEEKKVDSPATANEQRKWAIERAKEFVKAWTENNHDNFENEDFPFGLWFKETELVFQNIDAQFIVNAEKRTVVVLIKSADEGYVRARGIAKCMSDEVFNADIGKAIALCKALKLYIPDEFMYAVQPDEVVEGMVVYYESGDRKAIVANEGGRLRNLKSTYPSTARTHNATIIDDTNAKY